MHSIRFDLKVIVFQAWGISEALPGKEHCWPSAICKFGCFPWQVSSITGGGLQSGSQAGLWLVLPPQVARGLSQKKKKRGGGFQRGSDSCQQKCLAQLRGWKWHDLAQSPRGPPVCGFLLATHTFLLTTPKHPYTQRGPDISSQCVYKSENGMLPPKDRVSLCRVHAGGFMINNKSECPLTPYRLSRKYKGTESWSEVIIRKTYFLSQ